MSLLEMAKERVVRVDQKSLYGDIEVSAGERVDEDSVLEKYSRETEEQSGIDIIKEIQEA